MLFLAWFVLGLFLRLRCVLGFSGCGSAKVRDMFLRVLDAFLQLLVVFLQFLRGALAYSMLVLKIVGNCLTSFSDV